MNRTKLTLLSGLALAVIAVPVATAQRQTAQRAGASSSVSRTQSAALSGSVRSSASHRTGWRGDRGGNWRGDRGGDGRGDRGGNWRGGNRHGRHGHHHHHRHYRPRYAGYYGGFGYPYGYGYGYGYPFWGSSASLYFSRYRPDYYGREARGGSIAVEVQQELARAGYYRGAIDGVIGNGTRNAIRAYERDNGLRVDGRIDDRLLSRMGLG